MKTEVNGIEIVEGTLAPKDDISDTEYNKVGYVKGTRELRRKRLESWFANPEAMDILSDFMVAGGSLLHFCRLLDIPYVSSNRWIQNDPVRVKQYAEAIKLRAEALAEKVREVADDNSRDLMNGLDGAALFNRAATERAKIQIDALKWTAAKLDPSMYSERLQQIITGADGGAVNTSLTIKFETPKNDDLV